MRVFDQVFDSLKHLEYVEKALKCIDRKFQAEYKLLEHRKYSIYYAM